MRLLEPIGLGRVTARNRVFFGPHETNLGRRRSVSDRHVAYYRRRAAGGCGTVVVETASVHPSDWPYERAPLAAESAEGWTAVAAGAHEEGALALASLGHAGGQGSSAYSQLPLWAPSRVPDVSTREVPKAMEAGDIAAVVDGFAQATRLAVSTGLDGVEVNAGQYSLLRAFLSGLTNQRADEYGDDRLRLPREVLAAVRAAAGEAIVGLRLSGDELAPWAGIVPERAAEIAAGLVAFVDYVSVVRGSAYNTGATRPDGHTPPGFNAETCRLVRAALPAGTPVVAQGSIVDSDTAESFLTGGVADAVEMTRAQIADPDLAGKLSRGEAERVRPCILCNQACQVRDARNPVVSCVGEPASGHETEDRPYDGHPAAPLDVLVVGAGPAGLEAARVAALRGHRVRVVEATAEAGGALRVAARGAGRDRLALLADWLVAECRRLGVTIELGHAVTELPDGPVLLCTGSRAGAARYEIDDDAEVRSASEVLAGAALPASPVAVWDPIGGPIAISVAELLATDREVSLVTPDLLAGNELARTGDLAPANSRLQQAGVAIEKRSLLRRVRADAVEVSDRFSGEEREIKAAVLVDAGYRLPEDTLWRAHPERPRAGDAVSPRSVYEAVLEGRRAALALEGAP